MAAEILETFDALRQNGTLLRLRLPGRGYERLVVVSDIRTDSAPPLIVIDSPAGLSDLLKDRESPFALNFEFTGPDNLRCRFTPTDVRLQDNTLLAPLPTDLERVQRRKDFRLTAPLGALFYFTAGNCRKRVKMMDISISGASGILINVKNENRRPLTVEKGQTLLNLKLSFTVDGQADIIPVRECEVIRFESLPQKGRYLMAVAFTRMDAEHRSYLKNLLYDEQRHILKIRQQRA